MPILVEKTRQSDCLHVYHCLSVSVNFDWSSLCRNDKHCSAYAHGLPFVIDFRRYCTFEFSLMAFGGNDLGREFAQSDSLPTHALGEVRSCFA